MILEPFLINLLALLDGFSKLVLLAFGLSVEERDESFRFGSDTKFSKAITLSFVTSLSTLVKTGTNNLK